MRLAAAAFLLAPGLAHALLLLPNLPEGVYIANASGPAIPILDARNGTAGRLVSLEPRGGGSPKPKKSEVLPPHDIPPMGRVVTEELPIAAGATFCHDKDADLDHGEWLTAVNLLFEAPQFFMAQGSVRYALYGGAVAYVCNPGQLNSASLLEYMQAMDDIDARCGPSKAGKRTMRHWRKYYGRAVREGRICAFEGGLWDPKGPLELLNDLEDRARAGCKSHVNGYRSIFEEWEDPAECHDSAYRRGKLARLMGLFPWYKTYEDDDSKVMVSPTPAAKGDKKDEKSGKGKKGKDGENDEDGKKKTTKDKRQEDWGGEDELGDWGLEKRTVHWTA